MEYFPGKIMKHRQTGKCTYANDKYQDATNSNIDLSNARDFAFV